MIFVLVFNRNEVCLCMYMCLIKSNTDDTVKPKNGPSEINLHRMDTHIALTVFTIIIIQLYQACCSISDSVFVRICGYIILVCMALN